MMTRRRRRRRHPRGLATTLVAVLAVLSGPGRAPAEVFRLDEPPETRYRLAPFLTFGAELELDFSFRRNRDLDDRRDDDLSRLSPELSVAFSFDPAPWVQAFLNVTLSQDFTWLDGAGGARASDVMLEVKEAFVRLRRPEGGLSVQVGRQRFEDERTWLYDEELDAVRLRYARGNFAAELSVSRDELVRKDVLGRASRERTNNYILHAAYNPRDWLELEGYVIVRDHQAADRRRPVFVGVRSRGEPVEDLDYWLELAYVGGREGAKNIRGWAVEVGATYELQVGPRPSFTLGVAFGSGDPNPDDDIDRRFRQAGLQENEGDFGGSVSFKYYGELLRPELSNLAIITVGVGVRPREWFSLDLVYHVYLQHHASTTLRDARLEAEPSGGSHQLGSEVDFIVGLVDVLDRIDLKAVLGYFSPGPAFEGRRDGAWLVAAEVQFRF